MCGGAAGSVTSGAWSGAGNVLSSDDSVQYHSFTSGSSSNSSSSNSGNSGSGNNTSDTSKVSDDTGNDISTTVSVAIARCGVLCNLAEAHNALGDVDRATKRLSEALKALKSVQDVAPYQCAPALGHVLGEKIFDCFLFILY